MFNNSFPLETPKRSSTNITSLLQDSKKEWEKTIIENFTPSKRGFDRFFHDFI